MNISLHYTEYGKGRPLILLHGNGEDGAYFSGQIPFFSEWYRVIVPDTRGHGASPRGTAPFSIAQFAEDLYVFMDRLSLSQADILGFSDGGNIALTFALKYPHRVGRLILNGANLNPRGVKARFQIPIIWGWKIARFFAKKSPAAARNAEMLKLMVCEPQIDPLELHSLTFPVLVIAGTKDMIKESHTRLIAESLPYSEMAFIRGDHFIANKVPDEFNRIVAGFLSGTEKNQIDR